MSLYYSDESVTLYHGDCLDADRRAAVEADPDRPVRRCGVTGGVAVALDACDVRDSARSATTEPGPLATGHRLLRSTPPVRTTERRPLLVAHSLPSPPPAGQVPRRTAPQGVS